MKVLITGKVLAVTTYDGQHVNVLNIQPFFTVDTDNVEETADYLNLMFSQYFSNTMLSTEKFSDQEIKSLVRETLIPLIKNEEGVSCIRCSIADYFHTLTDIPTIIDYVPFVGGVRGLEFNCTNKYKAVVIDGLGYVHAMCGVSNLGIGNIVLSALPVAPEFDYGIQAFVPVSAGKHMAEETLINRFGRTPFKFIFSNKGHWFTN